MYVLGKNAQAYMFNNAGIECSCKCSGRKIGSTGFIVAEQG
jgi:hypothetical protein